MEFLHDICQRKSCNFTERLRERAISCSGKVPFPASFTIATPLRNSPHPPNSLMANAFLNALNKYDSDEEEKLVNECLEAAVSTSTLKAYKKHWSDFEHYSHKHNFDHEDAPAKYVARFIVLKGKLSGPGAANTAAAAIKYFYVCSGKISPTSDERVHLAMRGSNRKEGKPVKQALPMTPEVMRKLIETHLTHKEGRKKEEQLRACSSERRTRRIATSLLIVLRASCSSPSRTAPTVSMISTRRRASSCRGIFRRRHR